MSQPSLHEFFSQYFTVERGAAGKCHMMMFDDACANFGVYGYCNGNVYIMDSYD